MASASSDIGLTFTNACSQPGMVAIGTSRLLAKMIGNIAVNPKACTPCGGFTRSPINAEIQHMDSANASTSRHPLAAARGLVPIRKPRIMPKPSITATEIMYRITSPRSAPASGAQRAIGKLRKRSKTPALMSWLSISPVPSMAKSTLCTSKPGSAYCR